MKKERPAVDLEKALAELVAALRSTHEGDLLAVALYGSAAADDFVPGESDVNLLVILRAVTPAALRQAKPALATWPAAPPLLPLFLSPEELAAATDVFPIELLDMQERHRLLWGEDLLDRLTLSDADLRRQLEGELRGKWLRLRQSYMRDTGRPAALRSLLAESLSSFQVLFAAALHLRGDPRPTRRAELFSRAWEAFDLDAEVLKGAVALKEARESWPDDQMESVFERYLASVEKVLTWVDQWKSGRQ